MELNNQELSNIVGGGVKYKIIGGIIVAVITFIIGVVDGFQRPLPCNK